MSYLHEVLESGDPKAIEKLIRNGEYGEAKKEISDIISGIRSLEAEYDHAKKRYLLLKSEVQRLKAEGVIVADRSGEVFSMIEAGQFGEAVKLADGLISELRVVEEEYNSARAAYLLLKSETERIRHKSVIIADYTETIGDYLSLGRYSEAVAPATGYISEIRNVELSFDSATAGRRMLEIETARATGKGVILTVTVSPVDRLILEGRYPDASRKADELISSVRDIEAAYDSASSMLRILVAELSRLRDMGVVVPFDGEEPQSLISSGDYSKSLKSSEKLLSKLKKIESDYNTAENSLMILVSEVKRLSAAGMIVPFGLDEANDVFYSGEYKKSDRKSQSLLKKLRDSEIEFDLAIGALTLLESEIRRVTDKGMIIPYTTEGVEALIAEGSYKKAAKLAEGTIRKIRELESDYDIVINLFGIIKDEIDLLANRGIVVPFGTSELEELINTGRYGEAVPVAKDLLARLRKLEDDFFDRLRKEFERLKSLGIVIPFGTGDVEDALKAGDREGAREKADNLVVLLHRIESDFNGANDALKRLRDEIERLKGRGVLVPDITGDVEDLISGGDYSSARDMALGHLPVLKGIEKDYDSAYEALEELKAAISAADKRGIVHGIGFDDLLPLFDDGRYQDAGRSCRERLILLNGISRDFDAANDALKRLRDEIERLKSRGVLVPDETGRIGGMISSGDYSGARDEAFRQLSLLKGIEKDYDSAYDALEELKAAIAHAAEKGIVHSVSADDIESLLGEGKYHEGGRECRKAIIILKELEKIHDLVRELLSRLENEIQRLKARGVIVPDETGYIRELIANGDYLPARDEALGQLSVLMGIEKDYDSACDALEELKSAISAADKRGIVHGIGIDDLLPLFDEGSYQDAGRGCRERLVILNGICKDFDSASDALKRLKKEISRLNKKGVIVPDETERIGGMISSGDFAGARDEAFRQLSVLKGIEDDYNAADKALKTLTAEIGKGREKGIQVPDGTARVKELADSGEYRKAAELAVKELIIVREVIAEYSHAIEALEKLEKEISRLNKKGVIVPDNTGRVRELIASGDYGKATDEAYGQIVLIRGIEKDFDDAKESISTLADETRRLNKKGVVFNDESGQIEAMMAAGEYERVIVYANALLVTILSSEKDYDAAIEAYEALISEAERLRGLGVVIPDESGSVKDLIGGGDYSAARSGANAQLVRIVSIAKDYDAAIEALKFLKSEITRIREKGIVIQEDISGIEKMIKKGDYHNARISAQNRVLEIRSTEAEYEDAMDAYGTLRSEAARLKEKGVVFDEDHRAIDKLFTKGSYHDARQKIEARIIENKITEAEFDSAVSVLRTLEQEIGRLEKKGVIFTVSAGPVREMIASGEYASAREEAEAGLTKLWAAESDFDSAVEALENLRKEYKRVTAKGVVLADESGEVRDLIQKGQYHQARSRAEFIISGIRKVEKAYEDAVASLGTLEAEMGRLRKGGVIINMDSGEVSALISKGRYVEAAGLAADLISRLRKIEIEYTSAMEALGALENEISRLNKLGVIFAADGSTVRDLIAGGEYSKAVKESDNVISSLRKIEIEFNASNDAIGQLKAEIARLKKKTVVIDEDTSPAEKHHAGGRYLQSRKAAESHVARIKAVEIEYDSAVDALEMLGREISRLKKKGVMIKDDTSSTESLIGAGDYRKAKKSADDILARVKKVEREYDAATEVLKLLVSEHSRMTKKGVMLRVSPSNIEKLIAKGEYNSARKEGDAMISSIHETEAAYDAAVSALETYKRDVARANANNIPVQNESASVEKMLAKGAYKDARLESEALVSKVKAFEWEYELTISAYESLKAEVGRLKKEGIVVTDDPSQVEEFIKKGSYQQAKSISEGLLSKIKGTEWEYRLAVKTREALKSEVERVKKAGKKPGVDPGEVDEWIRRGDYRKAKSIAEDLLSVIGE